MLFPLFYLEESIPLTLYNMRKMTKRNIKGLISLKIKAGTLSEKRINKRML
jgi:hypothetical protein